jgi:DNA replication initiation complex subunit (GINS family)
MSCGEEGHYAADCELRKALNKVKAEFKKKKAASGLSGINPEFSKQVKECVAELAREREQSKYTSKESDSDVPSKIVQFAWANQEDLETGREYGPYGL